MSSRRKEVRVSEERIRVIESIDGKDIDKRIRVAEIALFRLVGAAGWAVLGQWFPRVSVRRVPVRWQGIGPLNLGVEDSVRSRGDVGARCVEEEEEVAKDKDTQLQQHRASNEEPHPG